MGTICVNDRGGQPHPLSPPDQDVDLHKVRDSLLDRPDLARQVGDAVEDSVFYVLDGYRTHRFDLLDERVEPDERKTVGTKLQYHLLDNLGLPKRRQPDTVIDGVNVDVKGTAPTGNKPSWMIPREGQCEICLLVHIDVRQGRHRSWVMRTHRVWLHGGDGNGDRKRGISMPAFREYAIPLYDWTSLRPNPLKMLSVDEQGVVFGRAGQEKRIIALFVARPGTVIQRSVILTVCANRADPMRRVRATRVAMARNGTALLCGTWTSHKQLADRLGYDLTGEAWAAVPMSDVMGHGDLTRQVLDSMKDGLNKEDDRALFEP